MKKSTSRFHKPIAVWSRFWGSPEPVARAKSSLVDELVRRFLLTIPDKTIAIISVDPSKRKTGGALLGDRIRMNAIHPDLAARRVYMRSLATRQANLALSKHVRNAIEICQWAQFDLIIIETSGIGQSDTEITEHSGREFICHDGGIRRSHPTGKD